MCWPNFDHVRQASPDSGSKLARFLPNSIKVDPHSADSEPNSADFGRSLVGSLNLANVGPHALETHCVPQHRPKYDLAESRSNSARTWSIPAWLMFANWSRMWSISAPKLAQLAEVGRNWPSSGQCDVGSAADFGRFASRSKRMSAYIPRVRTGVVPERRKSNVM